MKLIYRGEMFEIETPSSILPESDPRHFDLNFDCISIELIYRGHILNGVLFIPRLYQPPRGINWRWRTDCFAKKGKLVAQ